MYITLHTVYSSTQNLHALSHYLHRLCMAKLASDRADPVTGHQPLRREKEAVSYINEKCTLSEELTLARSALMALVVKGNRYLQLTHFFTTPSELLFRRMDCRIFVSSNIVRFLTTCPT